MRLTSIILCVAIVLIALTSGAEARHRHRKGDHRHHHRATSNIECPEGTVRTWFGFGPCVRECPEGAKYKHGRCVTGDGCGQGSSWFSWIGGCVISIFGALKDL